MAETDTKEIADKMIKKLVNMRIFADENDKTNLSINDVNGKLIQVNDVDGLVKAIEEYMQMGTDCSKIGRKAKAFVAHNYSEDVIARRFLQRVLCIEDF